MLTDRRECMWMQERMHGQRVNEWGVDGWVGGRKDGCWTGGWRKGKLADGKTEGWMGG